MLRSALLAACAFATCVAPATGYEVLVSEGRVVAPRNWVAVADAPALGVGVGSDAAAAPGLITLAPGGALRVTSARASAAGARADEDVRAAVVTLGALADGFDPNEGSKSLRVDVRSVETVEAFVPRSDETSSGATRVSKTVERLVTTSCALRRGARGAWAVVRDGSERTCTAERSFPTDTSAAGATKKGGAAGEDSLAATRVEVALGLLHPNLRTDATHMKTLSLSPTKRVASRRVDSVALVAVNEDERFSSSTALVVREVALLDRGDLVDLAWSWLARATHCASSVRADVARECGVGDWESWKTEHALSVDIASGGLTADALVDRCCAAVGAHREAGCGCALEVAEGLAPSFFPDARTLNGDGPSAMVRPNAGLAAAVATLEAVCFGGAASGDDTARAARADDGREPEEENERRRNENDPDSGDADAARRAASCVASSATLAATRAVALEAVMTGTATTTTRAFSASSEASPEASPLATSAKESPEQKEYAAFLRWLDGGANESASRAAAVKALDADAAVRRSETSAFGDGEAGDATVTAPRGDRVIQQKGSRVTNGETRALVVVVALLCAAALAACVRWCALAARRRRRRGGCALARASAASPRAAFALESGDEVRLVARRSAGGARTAPELPRARTTSNASEYPNARGTGFRVCGFVLISMLTSG